MPKPPKPPKGLIAVQSRQFLLDTSGKVPRTSAPLIVTTRTYTKKGRTREETCVKDALAVKATAVANRLNFHLNASLQAKEAKARYNARREARRQGFAAAPLETRVCPQCRNGMWKWIDDGHSRQCFCGHSEKTERFTHPSFFDLTPEIQ